MVRARRHAPDSAPIRITTAAESREREIHTRQVRYVVSMAIRTVCFVGAVAVGNNWVRWVLVAGAVFLPYVAVIMANAAHSRRDDYLLPDDLGRHRELGGGPSSPTGD